MRHKVLSLVKEKESGGCPKEKMMSKKCKGEGKNNNNKQRKKEKKMTEKKQKKNDKKGKLISCQLYTWKKDNKFAMLGRTGALSLIGSSEK